MKHSTTTVLGWVEQGESVQITRFNKVVAVLAPAAARKPKKKKVIRRDFENDLREIFGDRILPTTGTELMDYDRSNR
ncbi:MAG: hypothetical protein NTV46_10045 [Verrucomicrobia bacterium]|nr:hypothetical protein [Verrucomicrobiota bacterium]